GRAEQSRPIGILADLDEDASDGRLDCTVGHSVVVMRNDALDLGHLKARWLADLVLDLVDDPPDMLWQVGRTCHRMGGLLWIRRPIVRRLAGVRAARWCRAATGESLRG